MPSSTGSVHAAARAPPDTFDAAGYAQLLERVKREIDDPVYVPGFDRTLEQPLAAALVVLPTARLVVTEGNYLLLDDPHWARARRAMDAVWFVASEETMRVERLVARHVRVRQEPHEARAWVATTDQRNSELVAGTAWQGRPRHRQRRRRMGPRLAIRV